VKAEAEIWKAEILAGGRRWKMEDCGKHRTSNIEHPTSNEARIYFTGANRDRGERKEFQTTDGHGWTRIKSKS
jgi:hypothetical protein